MASNGENGVKQTYALSETHKDVSCSGRPPHLACTDSPTQMLEKSLVETDPEIAEIMVSSAIPVPLRVLTKIQKLEIQRQRESIILIASENVTSRAVFDALGS